MGTVMATMMANTTGWQNQSQSSLENLREPGLTFLASKIMKCEEITQNSYCAKQR